MRYFLDCEFDGFGGPLISLALVPDEGDEEYYAVLQHERPFSDWVERNVAPFLWMGVPDSLERDPKSAEAVAREVAAWLAGLSEVELVADWPDDIAYFCRLISYAPGKIVTVPPLTFRLLNLSGFSTARNSKVPHNALHDARSLRDHVISHLDWRQG
jgi:hypothetical protein